MEVDDDAPPAIAQKAEPVTGRKIRKRNRRSQRNRKLEKAALLEQQQNGKPQAEQHATLAKPKDKILPPSSKQTGGKPATLNTAKSTTLPKDEEEDMDEDVADGLCVQLDDQESDDSDEIEEGDEEVDDEDDDAGELESADDDDRTAAESAGGVYLGGKTKNVEPETVKKQPKSKNADEKEESHAGTPEPKLEFDRSTYKMYHSCQLLYPCMSFDIIAPPKNSAVTSSDDSSSNEVAFPIPNCYLVAGTQAEHANANRLLILKMSNITALRQRKKKKSSDDDDDDESSESEEDEPSKKPGAADQQKNAPDLQACEIRQRATINRVRMTYVNERKPLVACWYDNNLVSVWDVEQQMSTLDDARAMQHYKQDDRNRAPIYTFKGHRAEGFAMDWSLVTKGFLATGDCAGTIHVWKPSERGQWYVDEKPMRGHTGSVEDLQWSPTEANVLASASCDKSIRIWDIRKSGGGSKAAGCMLTSPDAHDGDVNVISWSKLHTHLLLSGGDDGVINVWDLRKFGSSSATTTTPSTPLAVFKFHSAPITSIEWCPHDSSVFAASSEDDRITQWDISVERDSDAAAAIDAEKGEEVAGVPPQLLFVHCGQTEIKELHWHPHYAGVMLSTAQQGIDIFKTISV